MIELQNGLTARMADLDAICEKTVPLFLDPVPKRETVKDWLDANRIPRFKMNPLAKRGGGKVYYSVAHVEKFLRSRTLVPA